MQDLTGYHGMILCNARGWAPVSRVDDLAITQDEAFAGVITAAIDNAHGMRSSRNDDSDLRQATEHIHQQPGAH